MEKSGRQCKISVHKGVARLLRTSLQREAAMAIRQMVATLGQHFTRVFGGVGLVPAVMEMNLHFTPSSVAMIGQHFKQALIVLLCRIEISVSQWASIVVAPPIHDFRIFARPPFDPAFLFRARNAISSILRVNCGLEVIRQCNHEMQRAARERAQRTPSRSRENFSGVRNLLPQTHVVGRDLSDLNRQRSARPFAAVSGPEPLLKPRRCACLPYPWLHTSGIPAHRYAWTDTSGNTSRRYRASASPRLGDGSQETHDGSHPRPEDPRAAPCASHGRDDKDPALPASVLRAASR